MKMTGRTSLALCLMSYGVISAIFNLLFWLAWKCGISPVRMGYPEMNRTEEGWCATLAVVAQQSILSFGVFVVGMVILFPRSGPKQRVQCVVFALLLGVAAFFNLIASGFCAG